VYLQGSSSLNALKLMNTAFPEGQLDPYQIIVTTGAAGAVLTPDYFIIEQTLISNLLATQTGFMDATSVSALSFFDSQVITFSEAISFFNSTSPAYNTETAGAYRTVVGKDYLLIICRGVDLKTLTHAHSNRLTRTYAHTQNFLFITNFYFSSYR
jgi:hypothetical protein